MIVSMDMEPFTTMKATFIPANFIMVRPMVTEYTIVKTEHNLKVNLNMDKNMESEHIHMPTEEPNKVIMKMVSFSMRFELYSSF